MNNDDDSLCKYAQREISPEILSPLITLLKSKNHSLPSSFEVFSMNEQIQYITQHLSKLLSQYERLLQNMESKERFYIRSLFAQKFQLDYLHSQMYSLLQMQDEYEHMKEKYRYEEGTFLHNDRKDHEIIILRKENTNLKNHIIQFEKDIETKKTLIKQLELTVQKQKTIINQKQQEINYLVNNNITSPGTLNSTSESQLNSASNKGHETNRNLHFPRNTLDILSQLTKYSSNNLQKIQTLKLNGNHSTTNKIKRTMIHCNSTANIMIPRVTSTDTKSNGNIRLYASRRARQFKRASPITTLNKVILPEK